MKEEWKPIKDYEGLYEVSNLGRVKSLKFGKEKLLKQGIDGCGYLMCILHNNSRRQTRTTHQIVSEAFLSHERCGYKLVVDHINDIKIDNRVENLQLITQRDNSFKTQGKYSSKYKGVCWDKNAKKWQSAIRINGNRIYLGLFNCELAAHLAYQNKLKEII